MFRGALGHILSPFLLSLPRTPLSSIRKHALCSSDEVPGITQDLIDTLSFRYGTGSVPPMLQGIHAASLLAFRGFHAC